ncbi:hypothetical protein QYE76_014873 [Lolium multiflorum]|uniref:Trichome birefringence-like C-terminal domain-containing protein n=1 Tax=Lolium multiflorum TaxID=4521 RepID=A0AAD8X679_LOLMU|nr:hypothetical protein QYE76_014873 [Lolium multiflorum]
MRAKSKQVARREKGSEVLVLFAGRKLSHDPFVLRACSTPRFSPKTAGRRVRRGFGGVRGTGPKGLSEIQNLHMPLGELRHHDKLRVLSAANEKVVDLFVDKSVDYNCTVEFFRSPFLVQELEVPLKHGKIKETLRLDKIDRSSSRYKNADIIVFNTGHWWTHEKTSIGKDYYQEGDQVYNQVYSELNVRDASESSKLNVRDASESSKHLGQVVGTGGQCNLGGSCDKETEPIANEQHLIPYPQKMSILEEVLRGMKTHVAYLNITRMTDFRKEGHPSIYRKQKLSEDRKAPELYQDCIHWFLPGVPDSWNEVLYAKILVKQHQMLHQ